MSALDKELEIRTRQRDYWQSERAKMHQFFAKHCRICYWPQDGRPPIVHNPFSDYDGDKMDALLAEMRDMDYPNGAGQTHPPKNKQ